MNRAADLYEFNLTQWQKVFPEPKRPHGGIYGPQDLVWHANYRRRLREIPNLGPTVPIDVFAWAIGDPPDRDRTQIGGLRYRPADRPWPIGEDGKPMVFLAQFRFCESRDIVGETPGDLLLIFVPHGGPYPCYNHETDGRPYLNGPCVFEWHPLGLTDLVERH